MRSFARSFAQFIAAGFAWLFLCQSAYGNGLAVRESSSSHEVDLTPYWSILEDRSQQLTIEDVSSPEYSNRFLASTDSNDAISLGVRPHAYWLRITLRNQSSKGLERYLEIGFPHLDYVDLYLPDTGGFRKIATGRISRFANRPVIHRYFIFPIALQAASEKTYYLRIQSQGPIHVPSRLWHPDHFNQQSQMEYMAQALYFGMMLALGIYNLLLYFSLRDRAHLYYVIFVACATLAMLSYSGIGYQFLWPESGHWAKISTMMFFATASMSLLMFQRQLLSTRETVPLLDKVMLGFIVLNILQAAGFAWSYEHMIRPGVAIDVITMVLALIVGAECLVRRQRSAGFFLLAFSFLLIMAVLMVLTIFGADLPNFIAMYGLQIGSALEILLLSLALADRFHQERQEKEAAQQQLLEGLKRSEQLLEKRVAERTAELVHANAELQEHEHALAAAKQVAEEASRMKSQFLANVSHEIRTPMNAVIGMAHLALRTDLTFKQRDYVEKIHRSAVALLGIMNDILDFSKIEAGKMVIERTVFSLSEVIDHVTNVTSNMAHDKQLEYLLDVEPDVPNRLIGDPLRLGQVLVNLVSNAVKFTPAGEVHLRCRIANSGPEWTRLNFEVRDTGIGMTPEQLRKLFHAFTQADSSISRKYGGTGLGLTISKRLVEMMGGTLTVRSETGTGSIFSFTLRFGLASPLNESAVRLPPALYAKRILVIDDNPVAREIMVRMLQSFRLQADTVWDGESALAAIIEADARKPYDLVLADMRMPGMGGLELARTLTSLSLSQPPKVVLVTAAGQEEAQQQASGTPLAGILFKPVNPSMLLDLLMTSVLPEYSAPSPASRKQRSVPLLAGSRVLLAEDNEINQQIAREMLAAAGLEVDIAANGRIALDKLFAAGPEAYDLVLMDIQMPELGGHAATQQIRADAQFARLPVIAMTAHASLEEREQCLRSGMQDHIAKPINPDQFYLTLQRWLKRKPSREAPPASSQTLSPPAAASDDDRQASDTLVQIPGFETQATLERIGGDVDLYHQLLGMLLPVMTDSLHKIDAAILSDDHVTIQLVAHNVAGMCSNVGAIELAATASALEQSVKKQQVSPAQVTAFRTGMELTIRAVESALTENRLLPAQ